MIHIRCFLPKSSLCCRAARPGAGSWICLGRSFHKRIRGQVPEETVQCVIGILLDLLDDVPHAGQHGWLGIIVHISLQQFEDVEAVARDPAQTP